MLKSWFGPRDPRDWRTAANGITLLRLALSLTFFSLALVRRDPALNYIGFLIHWIFDFFDGLCARTRLQETVLGAEMDLIADRVELIFFYVNFLHFRPFLATAAVLYLVDYAFIDFYLGYQFVKFDIISPNYFGAVDRSVYLWNFSPAAKFINSSLVTGILIFLPFLHPAAAALACGLIVVKTVSAVRLWKIRNASVKN
jgi:phosphatidylglycerophosphate synthase